MKEVLQRLIREYYSSDIIGKEVVITEDKGKKIMNIFDQLMPLKWHLVDTKNQPDIERAMKIIDNRKDMKARQIFQHTLLILGSESRKKYLNAEGKMVSVDKSAEWNEIYGKVPPTEKDDHKLLMDYSLGALYYMDIITPYEYVELSSIADEQGIIVGQQLHPKEQENPLEDVE